MSTLLANDFSFFDRTPLEARAGATFTGDNIQHIQNLLALAATTYLNIEDDPLNPALSSLRRAKLQGEIEAYRFLIIGHQSASQEAYDEAKEAADLDNQKKKYVSSTAMFSSGNGNIPVTDFAVK